MLSITEDADFTIMKYMKPNDLTIREQRCRLISIYNTDLNYGYCLIFRQIFGNQWEAFLSQEARSVQPSCRGYAYRILGLVSMRCFDVLGEKVVGQLLLKKRFQEDADNRMLITIILWNLLYVWPDYLAHVLLLPDGAISGHGEPIATVPRSLLEDFWEVSSLTQAGSSSRSQGNDKFSSSLRAVSILSGARIILAKRLPSPQINASVVRAIQILCQVRISQLYSAIFHEYYLMFASLNPTGS